MIEYLYIFGSVFIVSLISFIGVSTLVFSRKLLEKGVLFFVCFSAGALIGDALIHLLPESVEEGFTLSISLYLVAGIVFFFVMEKFIHWRHCHSPGHIHPFAYMNLVGDAVHNFMDGLIIAASYLISIPAGIATTIAVGLHEIPQELGDFGVLLRGGFSFSKALFVNFISGLTAVLGAVVAIVFGSAIEGVELFLLAFGAGGFLYIALADLVPEMHKETVVWRSVLQLLCFLGGVGVMALLLLLE